MSRDLERRRVGRLIFYGTFFLVVYLAYRIVQPFLVQIGWAVVLAIALSPIQGRVAKRLGATRTALVLTFLVVVLVITPIVLTGSALLQEGGDLVRDAESQLAEAGGAMAWLRTGWEWVRGRLPFLPSDDEVIAKVSQSLGSFAQFVAGQAGGLLKGAAFVVFNLVIVLGILFFLLRDAPHFAAGLRRLLPFGAEQNERLLTMTRDLVAASVTAMVTIAGLQGLIGGTTFALLGIRGALLWGMVMAVLALLPVGGATLVWLPTAAWLILSGETAKGIVLLGVGMVMGSMDNVIRPWLLSGKARMNTLVMILSILGGLSAFGFIGIVLGPLVASVLTALVESYVQGPLPAPAASSAETGGAQGTAVASLPAAPEPATASAPPAAEARSTDDPQAGAAPEKGRKPS
jgi:predicted PurR-regulated permease PerM